LDDRRRKSLRSLTLVQLSFWLRGGIIDPVLALFLRRTGFSVTEIGLLLMVGAIGWAIFEPTFGIIADRIGKKKLIVYSIVASSIVYLSYNFASSPWHFYVIQFALSSNMAAGAVSMRAMMVELLPETDRGKTYGRYMTIISTGQFLGPLVGGFLADNLGQSVPFYLSAALGIVGLAAALPMKYSERSSSKTQASQSLSYRGLITRPLLGLFLVRLVYMFNQNFQRSDLPILLHESERLSASETEIGLYMGVLRFTSAVSQVFLGILIDKFGTRKLAVLGLGLSGISYLALTSLGNILMLYPLALLQGVFFASAEMSMMIHLAMISPRGSSSKVLGLYGLFEDLGGMVAAPTLGLIYDRVGSFASTVYVSAVLLSDATLSFFLLRYSNSESGKEPTAGQ
jgi:MFS family permease